MKLSPLALAVAAALLGGCATSGGKSAAETTPGKFVNYACEGGKSFSLRYDAEGGTVRIRTHEGSAELTKGDRGLYRDDEGQWLLTLRAGSDTALNYKGEPKYKNCKAA